MHYLRFKQWLNIIRRKLAALVLQATHSANLILFAFPFSLLEEKSKKIQTLVSRVCGFWDACWWAICFHAISAFSRLSDACLLESWAGRWCLMEFMGAEWAGACLASCYLDGSRGIAECKWQSCSWRVCWEIPFLAKKNWFFQRHSV